MLFVSGRCPNCARFLDAYAQRAGGEPRFGETMAPKLRVMEVGTMDRNQLVVMGIRMVPTVVLQTGERYAGQDAFAWVSQFYAPLDAACSAGSCASSLGYSDLAPTAGAEVPTGGVVENHAPINFISLERGFLPPDHELVR